MRKSNTCINCCAYNCINTSLTKPDYSFFTIPNRDVERHILWLHRIGRADLITKPQKYRRICEEHFSPECIIYTNNRKILKKNAVPYVSVNRPDNATIQRAIYPAPPVAVQSASKWTQTADGIEITEYSPISESIQTQTIDEFEVDNFDDNCLPEQSLQQLCDTLLPQELAHLIKANHNLKRKTTGRFQDYKNFYIALYQTSPQAYHYLQSIFRLPTSTLIVKRYLQVGTEVNDKLIMTLKPRVAKMKAMEKNCSVLIESMSLKASLCYNIKEDKIIGFQEINGVKALKPATRALVVMIRGIFSNWKLPISYALVSGRVNGDEISAWICNLLKSLFEIGLNVRSLISTLEDDSINSAIPVSIETPYFFIGNRKVYYIFNAPDLIISVRDSMTSNEFHFEENVAKYEYIEKFYNEDQKRTLPIAGKLTRSHINPTSDEKKEVRYAAQLLSRTVANGLGNYIAFKRIDERGIGTVEFITKINDLFDMLNASNRRNEHKENKKAFSGDEKRNFFKDMLYLFETLTVIDSKSGKDVTLTTKFIRAFSITIKALLLLFENLKGEGHSFLLIKNLQLEALKIFFKQITKKQNTSTILTTEQFTSAFRKLFFSYHKKFTLKGCTKGELGNFLAHADKLDDGPCHYTKPMTEHNPGPSTNDEDIQIVKEDYNQINTPERHKLFFVSAYLLRRCRNNHHCTSLGDSEGVLFVPYDFVQSIEKMDEKFVEVFESQQINHKIAASAYNEIERINFTLPCRSFPKKFLIKLFIRIRIFYTIRANNRNFRKNQNTLNFSVPRLS